MSQIVGQGDSDDVGSSELQESEQIHIAVTSEV